MPGGARRSPRGPRSTSARRRSIHGRSSRTPAAASRSRARCGSMTSTSPLGLDPRRARGARGRSGGRCTRAAVVHRIQATARGGSSGLAIMAADGALSRKAPAGRPAALPGLRQRRSAELGSDYEVSGGGSSSSASCARTRSAAGAGRSARGASAPTARTTRSTCAGRARRHAGRRRAARDHDDRGVVGSGAALRGALLQRRVPRAQQLQRAEDRARRRRAVQRVEVDARARRRPAARRTAASRRRRRAPRPPPGSSARASSSLAQPVRDDGAAQRRDPLELGDVRDRHDAGDDRHLDADRARARDEVEVGGVVEEQLRDEEVARRRRPSSLRWRRSSSALVAWMCVSGKHAAPIAKP